MMYSSMCCSNDTDSQFVLPFLITYSSLFLLESSSSFFLTQLSFISLPPRSPLSSPFLLFSLPHLSYTFLSSPLLFIFSFLFSSSLVYPLFFPFPFSTLLFSSLYFHTIWYQTLFFLPLVQDPQQTTHEVRRHSFNLSS